MRPEPRVTDQPVHPFLEDGDIPGMYASVVWGTIGRDGSELSLPPHPPGAGETPTYAIQ